MPRRARVRIYSLFFGLILTLFLLIPSTSHATTAPEYIDTGEGQLFSETVNGALQAHDTFANAHADYFDDPVINAYLALTRLLKLGLTDDSGALTDLLSKFGIRRSGDSLDTLGFEPDLIDGEHFTVPETAPSGETVRAFLADTLLPAINHSIENLDTTLFGPSGWTADTDKHNISKTKLDSDMDIEVDNGDIYLFRAMLKFAKAAILIVTSYDMDVDVREILSLINMDFFNVKAFLDRYPDFLNLLTTSSTPSVDGAAQLSKARTTLISAIDDYLAASDRIRNDPGTEPGAEELIEIYPEDVHVEQLFRENLIELKASLNENRAADLILRRIGTEYHVYGGDSFSTTEPYYWEKGYHPEDYGYTYLGSADDTQTFSGTYAVYIINTSSGNIAPVDTVEGSNGKYYGTNIDGNTLDWANVGGAPDSNYALVGGLNEGEGPGFIVIQPPSTVNSITVHIDTTARNQIIQQYEEHLLLDLNPLFGNGAGPNNLRDFLPDFNCYGEPVHGTMGHGLGNDATLGGIFPDFTQDDWGLEGISASGEISIPQVTINVQDGSVTDWKGINPVFQDVTGDGDPSHSGSDLQNVYLVKDSRFLYGRMTLADGPPNQNTQSDPWQAMGYFVQFQPRPAMFPGGITVQVDFLDGNWRVQVWEGQESHQSQILSTYTTGYAEAVGNDLEWKVPLADLGSITGRFIATWTQWIPYSQEPIDENETCLQIGPLSSISGTLNVPAYDGTGPIYIGVYRSENGAFNPEDKNLLGKEIIYPADYTSGMTYTVDGLPVGEEVFVTARWDADYTGLWTRGDYSTEIGPYTIAAGGTTGANLQPATMYATDEETPYFISCNVMAMNTPSGTWTTFDVMVGDPNGTVPDTIQSLTVSGPDGFSYIFTPSDYITYFGEYWHGISGQQPAVGEYTFTVTDNEGKTATSHYYFSGGTTIPIPDQSTLQASGDFLAPTLSWGAVTGYQGNLFYRARIFNAADDSIVWTSGFTCLTSLQVPEGILQQGKDYKWRVEAFDNYDYFASNQRAVTNQVSLTIDDWNPYFNWATVFHRHDAEGDWTQIEVSVVDPDGNVPSSIQTLQVYGPDDNLLHSFQSSEYYSGFQEYVTKFSGNPAQGVYKFVVSDTDGNTKTTYDYVGPSFEIPLVDSTTLQASGDSLTPTLSWGAPATMDRPIYFRAIVEDTQGNRIWASGRIHQTYIQVPAGKLQSGGTYQWYVRTIDDSNWTHFSNQGWSVKVDLVLDNSTPFFNSAAVYQRHDPDGVYTAFDASIADPNGTLPESLQSLTVTDPNNNTYDLLANGVYISDWSDFFLKTPGAPAAGVYTFTVKDNEGKTAVTHEWVGAAGEIPLVQQASISVTGDPLAPTLSWSGISGYQGNLYYRIWVQDTEGNFIYISSRAPYTSQTIPEGKLEAGKTYLARVEAQDHRYWTVYNSRSNTGWVLWSTQGALVTGISGHVTDTLGNPLQNVWVSAQTAPSGGEWLAGTSTDQNGEFTLTGLPPGNIYINACASCSGLNYVDKWYEGVYNCNDATPVSVIGGQVKYGIDFTLETGGSISGHVYKDDGITPINNMHVYATDFNTDKWVAGTFTAQDGSYSLIVPTGTYRVRGCPSCSNLSYIDEYYNNTTSWDQATAVAVTAPNDRPGIDFTLSSTLKRATEQAAAGDALTWLAQQQNPDGSWGIQHALAKTGFAVLAFEKYARDQGLSPLDSGYQYQANVINGLNYIFANAYTTPVTSQPAGNPDGDGDGVGVYFAMSDDPDHTTYYTAIAAMAVAASGEPNEMVNVSGSPVNGWTYAQLIQDVVDYLAWGQTDSGPGRGGWSYGPTNNDNTRSDQSNTGYVTLALAYAEAAPPEGMGVAIPGFVRSELEYWINYIQDPVDGDENDGGSWYSEPGSPDDASPNVLKTGNLLQQMAFVGDTRSSSRVQAAIDYMVRSWNSWDLEGSPLCYQSSYTTMKGLEAIGAEIIDSINWFQDLSDRIRTQQSQEGWWPVSCYDDGDGILSTEWAILTLQRAVAPTEENPDLEIIDLEVSEAAGNYTILFTLKNRGNVPAPLGHVVGLKVDGALVDQVSVNSELAPGETWSGSFAPRAVSGIRDAVQVCADETDVVAELNEDNNCSGLVWPPIGDISGDRFVTLADAILALQVSAGLSPAGVQVSGDVNGDWRIGLEEAVYVLQEVSGLR